MKKIISVIVCVICVICGYAQQDPQYSQYMVNPLALNPATAGSRDVLSTSMLYRDQWMDIDGEPRTASLSVQMPLRKKRIGLGAEIISDKLGPKNVSAFLLSYAYRIPLKKGTLSFGLRTGIYNYTFDLSKIHAQTMDDIVYNKGISSSKTTGTGDFGMYYCSRTFYWGMGMTHLFKGKITDGSGDSSARQVTHWFIPIGKAYQVGNTVINPSILIKAAGQAPPAIDLSINVLLKERFWIGLSARFGYGTVFLAQYLIKDNMKVGYSFDYGSGSNKIGKAGGGTHEIMIGYDLNVRGTKMAMPRYL